MLHRTRRIIRDVLGDAQADALRGRRRGLRGLLLDSRGQVGFGAFILLDGDGHVIDANPFRNLITDAGDLYYAKKDIAAITPAAPSAPTAMNGMKLGTGSGTPAKNGTNAALGSYISGSNQAFDATYPNYTNLGAGLGVKTTYQTTYAPGTATSAGIGEAVLVNDAGTNATTLAANTYARTLNPNGVQAKAAGDTLIVNWSHLNKGA